MVPPAPARSSGSSARVIRSVPSTFTSNIHCHPAGSPSATGSMPTAPPALLTSTSQPSSAAANSSTDAWSVTSSRTGRAPISPASSASRSSRRAATTTEKPSATSRRAVAAPMPLLAPVTTAIPGMRPDPTMSFVRPWTRSAPRARPAHPLGMMGAWRIGEVGWPSGCCGTRSGRWSG